MKKAVVSDIDYATGMISVIYNDGGGGVTDYLPSLCIGNEYSMPETGDTVAVAKTATGKGIVLGKLWSRGNKPPVSGKDVYSKQTGNGADIVSENGNTVFNSEGTAALNAKDIVFNTDAGSISVSEIIKKLQQQG